MSTKSTLLRRLQASQNKAPPPHPDGIGPVCCWCLPCNWSCRVIMITMQSGFPKARLDWSPPPTRTPTPPYWLCPPPQSLVRAAIWNSWFHFASPFPVCLCLEVATRKQRLLCVLERFGWRCWQFNVFFFFFVQRGLWHWSFSVGHFSPKSDHNIWGLLSPKMPYAAVFETHMVTDCEALSGSGVKEHNAPDLLYQQMSLALIFHVGEPLRAFWNQAQSRLCRMLLTHQNAETDSSPPNPRRRLQGRNEMNYFN